MESGMLTPPKIKIPVNFNKDAQASLINAAMTVPFDYVQIAQDPLQKYSKNEITEHWIEYMENPPDVEFEPYENKKIPFSKDEDFILLTYIKNKDEIELQNFLQKFKHVIKPFRSLRSIEHRIEELSEMNEDEIQSLKMKFLEKVENEYSFYLSTLSKKNGSIYSRYRCNKKDVECVCDENVEKEIQNLQSNIQLFSSSLIPSDCLAILRTDNFEYQMKKESILIGRGTNDFDVDVDLSLGNLCSCTHTSRNQAILTFMEDCNFYLENIGSRSFRVNGKILKNGDKCILKEGALLDFMDSLFVFIPNLSIIDEIKKAYENPAPTRSKK